MLAGTSVAPSHSPALVLVILDGLGDRAGEAEPSPVTSARTPNLDRLLSLGQIGEVLVVGPGVAPESDAGVLALMGYDPVRDSPGRGVLEGLGAEVPLGPDDVALRLNFATVDGDGAVVDSRVGRSLTTGEARSLAADLTAADLLADMGVHAEVRATVGHRGVLWLHPTRDGPLSANVSNADPFYEKVGGLGHARRPSQPRVLEVVPLDGSDPAARTARAINQLIARAGPVLAGHRLNARRALAGKRIANGILVRNAGSLPVHGPRSLEETQGLRGAAVTEMPVERGIAKLLGLDDRFVGPMTGDPDEGYRARAAEVRRLAERFPFVYVHLKGPDEPGHDGDSARKQATIEAIDRAFFGPLLEGLDLGRFRIAVTADHATPCSLKGHSDDPVPLLLAGAGVESRRGAGPAKFGEESAARGTLGRRLGREVLPLLKSPAPPA